MDWKKLIASLAVCFAAAAIGSAFTTPSIATWYASLAKPWFSPPNWIFGPVWTLLYAMMGLSLYYVLEKGFKKHSEAIYLFGAQLALNALWSVLFFGWRNPALAMLEITVLMFVVLATTVKFYSISEKAGRLLIPYIVWITFASILNFNVMLLN